MAVLLGRTSQTSPADDFITGPMAVSFTALQSGNLSVIKAQTGLTGNEDLTGFQLGVYANSGGLPGALLAAADVDSLAAAQGAGVFQATLATPLAITAGTVYHLAIGMTGGSGRLDFRGQSGVSSGYRERNVAYPLPNPFGTVAFTGTIQPVIWGESIGPAAPISLGTFHDTGGDNSAALTTSAAVPAGARVFLAVLYVDSVNTRRSSTVSGGSLTWTEDGEHVATTAGEVRGAAIWSAPAPSGLTSNTVLTATFDGALSWGAHLHAFYVEDLDETNYKDGTIVGASDSSNPFSTPSLTTAADNELVIVTGLGDGQSASTYTPGSGYTEINRLFDSSDTWLSVVQYRLVTTAGSYSAAGTWGSTPNPAAHRSMMAFAGAGATGPVQEIRPDADLNTSGWTTAPVFSKVNDESDATVVTGALT